MLKARLRRLTLVPLTVTYVMVDSRALHWYSKTLMVFTAIMGTKNSSAPGPDGVSYRLIKAVRDTPLGQGVMKEVAEGLLEGRTLPE